MTTLIVETALIVLTASALALWNGWGLARLSLPAALQPWRALLVPLLGYAVTILVGYWVVRTFGGLDVALWLLLPVTGLINWLAWRQSGPPQLLAGLRQHWPALIVLTIGIALGVAPLFSFGYAAPIGGGWDVENYWPTARYLTRGPVSAIAAAPDNPLRDLNADPPRIGLTLGFSVWQGSVDLLAASEPLVSFAPLLAWLRALGGLGIYVLLQAMFGLRRAAACFGALSAVLNSLLLWVSFFNFGMQLAAWPLIPLALTLGLAVVQAARPGRELLAAGIGLAALPVAYYPALGIVAPMAAGLGIVTLWQTRPRWPLLRQAGLVALITLALAAPTLPDYFAGFNYRYSLPLTTLGLFRFISPGEIIGLSAFRLREPAPPLDPLALTAAVILIGLAGYGLGAGPHRARWFGLLAGAGGFLLYLRFGSGYHYGYLKAAAYTGWMISALAASGAQAWLDRSVRHPRWIKTVSVSVMVMITGGALALSSGQIIAQHWGTPGLFAGELPALRELRRLVPAGSTVTLTGDPRAQGVTSALAAYLLDHATVWGNTRTGYATASAGLPDAIGEYGLLQRDEDPTIWGYTDPPIWSGGSYSLYRRPTTVLAHLRLEQQLEQNQPFTLHLAANRLATSAPLPDAEQATRWIALQTVTMAPGDLIIDGQSYAIPAGHAWLTIGPLTTPRALTIQSVSAEPIALRAASLTTAPGSTLLNSSHSVVISASSQAQQLTVTTTIDVLTPTSGPIVIALELWDRRQGHFFGRYGLRLGPDRIAQQVNITLDLNSGAANAQNAPGMPIPLGIQTGTTLPGAYTARLWIGTDQRMLLSPVDLFAFTIDQTGARQIEWVAQRPLLTACLDRPLRSLSASFGDEMRLIGYDLNASQLVAGDTLLITLWWQILRDQLDERSILLHLRNAADERIVGADGPPADGARPASAWRAGELLIDDRRLVLPSDLTPGRYWLVIGMYRWPSLEPIPLISVEDGVIRIPIEIRSAPRAAQQPR